VGFAAQAVGEGAQEAMSEMLWGGRFGSGPDSEMLRLTASIDVDIELLEQDVAVTKAHARTLVKAGLLEAESLDAIDDVLAGLMREYRAGTLKPGAGDEDVHSLVERALTERLGEVGSRIHAGRSRNDLVAADLRLWCKEQADVLASSVSDFVLVLTEVAGDHTETVMPGYTHLQRAQPVSLAFHLLAHGFASARDGQRFINARDAADVSALGAGAIAGNTLDLDPNVAAAELGFSKVFDNAMDAVSDRDFVADLLYACALCGVHLSRLAEEIVLWTSSEFAFARLADEWSTGSSMMPQKRNPDLAELIRGRSAGGIGDLTALLTMLKGLPLAYDRDLQEDKDVLFRAVRRTRDALVGMIHVVRALRFDTERMATAATESATWATDLAEHLVSRGVPFRGAHEAVGRLVAALEDSSKMLGELSEDYLQSFHPLLEKDDAEVVDPVRALEARSGRGGTAPAAVAHQIERLRELASRLIS
jgi:argininosuccinate lyase